MSGPVESELLLALATVDPNARLRALVDLLPRLSGALLRRAAEDILRLATEIADLPERMDALLELAPMVSGDLLQRAMDAVRETEVLLASRPAPFPSLSRRLHTDSDDQPWDRGVPESRWISEPELYHGIPQSPAQSEVPLSPVTGGREKKAPTKIPRKKPPAKKGSARRAAAERPPANKAGTRRAVADRAPAKKGGAPRAAAERPPANKAATRRAAAERAPVKKTGAKRAAEPAPTPKTGAGRAAQPDPAPAPERLETMPIDRDVVSDDGIVDAISAPTARTERPLVSHGFSDPAAADSIIPLQHSLALGRPYYFWLEIGAPVEGSATRGRVRLQVELLPADAELDILLFAHGGGFVVPADGGRIRVSAKEIRVTRPVSRPEVSPVLLDRRLFFAVTAPKQPGEHHLWCHIYYQGVLVQSHDVEVVVATERRDLGRLSIMSRMDYTLSTKLEAGSLVAFKEHRLSIAAGPGPMGSHGFWFAAGQGEFRRDAKFDGHEVQDLIERARRAFRMVSWGTATPWQRCALYRYEQPATQSRLTTDLARLAIAGYRNYDAMIERLGGGGAELAALMRTPGVIQLALKESARLVLPIALTYDHTLDVDGRLEQYSLCEQFSRSTDDLEHHPCFQGNCPYREVPGNRRVCPSGFWGFRHEIGVPPTLGAGNGSPENLPGILACPSAPTVIVAISTDPEMRERDDHIRKLKMLLRPDTPVAETRAAALKLLRAGGAHLVYFYCHGGVNDDVPYLQIGAPSERISRATLRSEGVRWIDPRALVFVNGCHTTDLEPERAIDLVTGFIQTARSSGVIGTEITVFEPLATAFAEAFLARLLERRTVGAAVRLARLRLLKDWNPLGLLYVPFAMATLSLSSNAA